LNDNIIRVAALPWVQGATPFFVLNEFAHAPSIEGDSKRRWNYLDISPLVKGTITLFSDGRFTTSSFFV
jgi:hypothetical protein